MKSLYALIGSLMLASAVHAQQPPPPADGGGPPPAGERPDGPGGHQRGPGFGGGQGDRPPGHPGGGRGGFGGGPGGGSSFGPGGGPQDSRMRQFEMLRGYLEIVDRYARLAHDPSTSGIAAVVAANDLLRPKGADAGIEYFNKLLPEVKSPAVQRAIRLQLAELYKISGKADQALEQLKMLMIAEPGPTPPASAQQ